jgi:hypothetical protein
MKNKIFMSFAFFALAISVSSCLGDKTQDDYLRDRVADQRAKIEAISGAYRGTISSEETGASLGTLSMDLNADVVTQNSYDNTATQLKAVARGTIKYAGLNTSQVTYNQGHYDDVSHTLTIDIPVTDASGSSHNLTLHGIVDGDTITGTIEEDTAYGYTANFTLIKNGPTSVAQHLSSGRAAEIAAQSQVFTGGSPEEGNKITYNMTIQYKETSAEQLFLNLFVSAKKVVVTWQRGDVQFNFPAANFDERANTLSGDTDIAYNGSSYHVRLDCNRSNAGTPNVKWDCRTSAGGIVNHAVLSPTIDAQTPEMN